jgi:transmembrane 9 superfamily protein 2/4
MPVTWCYDVEGDQKYCSPGFPIGCYVTKESKAKDACVTSADFHKPDTYYLFNHVDITLTYHSSSDADWGTAISGVGGRLISAKLEPKR